MNDSGSTPPGERPIVEAQGLWKAYRLGERKTAGRYLITNVWRSLLSRVSGGEGASADVDEVREQQPFWALRDVSFAVRRGEVLGIVGPNGAGKSTLLRILSRITDPTRGQAVIRGRPYCLLGVGTGFHPEFTGRENIYLKGAVHGLSRRQVDRRFDEVVAFAGVEKFLDTPLKRYSSGMRSRLGFALATTTDCEILILDEVFAVGDRRFKQQAREHIKRIAAEDGRTVLIVSHMPSAIQQLCTRAIFIEHGRLVMDGEVGDVLTRYLGDPQGGTVRGGDFIRKVVVNNAEGRPERVIPTGTALHVAIDLEGLQSESKWSAFVQIGRAGKRPLLRYRSRLAGCRVRSDSEGWCRLVCTIDSLPLVPGDYALGVGLDRGRERADLVEEAVRLEVVASDVYGVASELRSDDGPLVVSGAWRCEDRRREGR